MFIIVLSHTVMSLCGGDYPELISNNEFVINLSVSTFDVSKIVLSCLRYCGALGNNIFFLCSAWFLQERCDTSKKKIVYILADAWIISLLFVIAFLKLRKGNIPYTLLIKSLFPTIFANNWYVTCYILFMIIYPFLNLIIRNLSQNRLIKICVFLAFIYIGLNFFTTVLYSTPLVLWITIYFCVAAIKKYYLNIFNNIKINIVIFATGIICNTALIAATNYLGMRIDVFNGQILHWARNCNPFIIMIAFSLFNIARVTDFTSKLINQIAKLTLLIYILHDNLLFRIYGRTEIWHYIYLKFGHDFDILFSFAIATGLFMLSVVAGYLYTVTLGKLIHRMCDFVSSKICTHLQSE